MPGTSAFQRFVVGHMAVNGTTLTLGATALHLWTAYLLLIHWNHVDSVSRKP